MLAQALTCDSHPLDARLLLDADHFEVVEAVMAATTSVWIATANLKELMVPSGWRRKRRWCSILETFESLAASGVELRILHSSLPSRAFRDRFEHKPRLFRGGLELRVCPRAHLKAVVVDGSLLYLGSANWTGAGLGAKGDSRRNFELGLITDDARLIDQVQGYVDSIWRGRRCRGCRLRRECPDPLDC